MSVPTLRSKGRPKRRAPSTGVAAVVAALAVVLSACAGPSPADRDAPPPTEARQTEGGADTTPPSPSPPQADAAIRRLTPGEWNNMVDAGMVRPECPVQRPSVLRVVEVNHMDFDGEVRRGKLVVNADVAESVARIFTTLFDEQFPIQSMRPVEAFGGDTNLSLAADNTSAFNCRRADQINAPFGESPHANGRAVDINPRENPWRDLRCDCWLPSPENRKRDAAPGKIGKGGLVWRLFRTEGWIWQNIDVPDYMHFDTGYPSAPFDGAR